MEITPKKPLPEESKLEDRRKAYMYYFTQNVRFQNEIEKHGFYFSSPLSFNDPLDCDFRILHEYLGALSHSELNDLREGCFEEIHQKKIEQGKQRALKLIDQGWTFGVDHRSTSRNFSQSIMSHANSHIDKLANISKDTTTEDFRNVLIQWTDEIISSMGVKCFTKRWNNILLWAHYGNSHKGVCVGVYKPEHLIKRWHYNVGHFNIKYVQRKEIKANINSLRQLIIKFMTMKFQDWEYEEESRILSFKGGGILPFRCSSIREVILGDRWFFIPPNCSEEETVRITRERKCFIDSLMRIRRKQANKKLKIYIAEATPYISKIQRHEIYDNENYLLLNAAQWSKNNKQAFSYISKKRTH